MTQGTQRGTYPGNGICSVIASEKKARTYVMYLCKHFSCGLTWVKLYYKITQNVVKIKPACQPIHTWSIYYDLYRDDHLRHPIHYVTLTVYRTRQA